MDKKTGRKAMRAALEKLDEKERKEISERLQQNLFQTDLWNNAEVIGVYLSVGTEWDTRGIIRQALEEGKRVCIPKTLPETREMVFYQVEDSSQVAPGHWGLDEPIVEKTTPVSKQDIDLLIVPGLLFTRTGYRIGQGGGYYDRFLADFINPTVSLLHTNQLVESIQIEHFDIPINYLITEEGMIS
jgi:5-formyltetrahydrofolate cyclo-ligase